VERKRRFLLKLVGIAAVVALVVALESRLDFSTLFSSDRIETQLETAGPLAPVVFILAMALAVVSPLPTLPLDILAGRLFGPFLGTLYAVTGATLGALVSFLIARWLGREFISRFLKGHINFCRQCSDRLLTKVVFLARLIPLVSFDIVSYGAGLTRMSWNRFALASFVGMLPLTFVYTSVGGLLFTNRFLTWLGGTFFVALFFLLPMWIERYDLFGMSRHFSHDEPPET